MMMIIIIIEIQRMWNLKCTIIPVIIGATGIVTRSLRENVEAVPGKHSIDSLQKTAVLGILHGKCCVRFLFYPALCIP